MENHLREHPPGEERFFSNTVALVLYTAVSTALTLLQVKLLAVFLPREDFGLFASLRGFSLLLAMISSNGLPALLVRYFPVHESDRNRGSAVRLCSVSLMITIVLFGASLFIVKSGKTFFLGYLSSEQMTPRLQFWFFTTTLGVALKLVIYGGLNGMRRLAHQVILETLSIFAVLVWIVIERDHLDVELLFRILGSVSLGTVVVAIPILFSFFSFKTRRGGEAGRNASSGRDEAGYGSYWLGAAGLSLVALAFTDVDRYLLSQLISLELLALFHVGSRITRLANRLLNVPVLAFQPEITRLDTEGRTASAVFFMRVFLKFNTALSIFITLSVIVFSREIVVVVSNRDYLSVIPLLILLSATLPLSTMTAPITSVMKARDQVRAALYCDLCWAIVYVGMMFAVVVPFGVIGVGYAHMLACLAQLLLALKVSNVSVGAGFIAGIAARLLACGAAAFLPVALFDVLLISNVSSVYFYTGKIVLFGGAIMIFGRTVRIVSIFDERERDTISEMLGKRGLGVLASYFTGRKFN